VTMRATIDREGTVSEVQDIVASHPDLEAPAVEAVRDWKFTATLLNCEPIEVEMTVTVNFSTAP
jgi:TonB family protein